MSNGLPHLPNPDNDKWSLVAYADGYRTSDDKHRVDHVIGGDDFCEILPLLTPQPDGRILHAEIVNGIAGGATHFAIEIDAQRFTLNIVARGPQENR